MKKILLAALCVAMAAPAFARDHQLNGYFRVRGIMADLSKQKNNDPDMLVDQRFRAKYTLGLNEYLKVVYFGEVDFQWGDDSYATARNDGGALGGDTVNLETKNLYLEVKVPETPIAATLGLQGYGDNYDAVLFSADMAGLKLGAKFGPADVTLGWFKWQEGEATNNNSPGGSAQEDDIDLYALNLGFKPMDALKVGLDGYYVNANAASNGKANGLDNLPSAADLYYVGVNADYKAAMFGVKGWFLYGAGTLKASAATRNEEIDIAGWAASAKATTKIGPVGLGLRLAYFSADDDMTDTDYDALATPAIGETFSFYDENLMLMVNDAFWNTYGQYGFAMTDAAYKGYGLWFAALSGSFVPPALKNMYVKAGVGYFAAIEDDQKDTDTKREGTVLGTEVAVRVGYKMAEALDLSINAATAFLGDFYDKTATDLDDGSTGNDPDNPYVVYLMANLSY